MTDLETFKGMLKRAGIQWKEGYCSGNLDEYCTTGEAGDTIIEPLNVKGYLGFFTEIAFAPDGSLRAIGCWE